MNMHDPHALGTREELPASYLDELTAANLVPLWPNLRDALPHGAPHTKTRATLWPWASIRPLLLRAGELTPMEKAERRVLVLANPGRGLENLQASAGMLPRHAARAARRGRAQPPAYAERGAHRRRRRGRLHGGPGRERARWSAAT